MGFFGIALFFSTLLSFSTFQCKMLGYVTSSFLKSAKKCSRGRVWSLARFAFGFGFGAQPYGIFAYNLPMVDINVVLNALSENLYNKQVLPTPESPINNNLNSKS